MKPKTYLSTDIFNKPRKIHNRRYNHKWLVFDEEYTSRSQKKWAKQFDDKGENK